MSTARLASLELADPPERWRALGSESPTRGCGSETCGLVLGAPGEGIVGWQLQGLERAAEIDGLPPAGPVTSDHAAWQGRTPTAPSGSTTWSSVTPDFDRTAAALDAAGLALRRIRDAGGFRQGFRRLGPAILELVEAPDSRRARRASGAWS